MAIDTAVREGAAASTAAPAVVYAQRLREREQFVRETDAMLDRLGMLRLLVFGTALALAWLVFVAQALSPWWLLVPAAAFAALLIRYDRVRRAHQRALRAARYWQFGLDRIGDRWHGKGNAGERYLSDKHLYAQDLDIFGKGSLFERICTTRTRPGEETLAGWLLAPAPPQEIARRQEAVRDLAGRLELREDLALLGAEVPPVDFAPLVRWSESPPLLDGPRLRGLFVALGALNLAAVIGRFALDAVVVSIGGFAFDFRSVFLVAVFAASALAYWRVAGAVRRVLEPVEPMGRDLFLLAGVLARVEREPFGAPLLRELQAELQVEGRPPSAQIGRLAAVVDWHNAMRNQFFLPLALLLLWPVQVAFALEAWRRRTGPVIAKWLAAVGAIEALSSLAGYAYENPDDVFAEVAFGSACFEAADIGHPLLPLQQCVRNDVRLAAPVRALIVSGSNMSGKSTLLRTVGVNAVLALAGAPVRARRLRLTPLAIGATLRVQDSLLAGRSRFFAEISRVRDIIDRVNGPLPVLFLLDELFHGTNSHDRGIGAEALLRRLLAAGAIGLVTTHDLSLTRIADALGGEAVNVHFADQFTDGQMHFDYKMRPGVVPHSNALSLMRAIGLEV